MQLPEATRANVAALIPAYHEERQIRDVVERTRRELNRVLVVDDGSADGTAEQARVGGAEVIRHEKNGGKGAAIKTGIRRLLEEESIEYILILDGDGQHLPEEIACFLESAKKHNAQLVVGNRMENVKDMPLIRKWTNWYTSWTISRVIGQRVPDSQCGFRMFHRSLAKEFLTTESVAFDFESEMLSIAARKGCTIAAAPVSTIYQGEVSKIHPLRDTLKFFRLLRRLKREARSPRASSNTKAPDQASKAGIAPTEGA